MFDAEMIEKARGIMAAKAPLPATFTVYPGIEAISITVYGDIHLYFWISVQFDGTCQYVRLLFPDSYGIVLFCCVCFVI